MLRARHAKANEKYVITQTKGESASGYLYQKNLLEIVRRSVYKGALPPSNKANQEKRVALGKDQNVISGKIAQQPSFRNRILLMAKEEAEETSGYGRWFSTGAVKNINKNGGKKWLVQKKDRVMRLSSH